MALGLRQRDSNNIVFTMYTPCRLGRQDRAEGCRSASLHGRKTINRASQCADGRGNPLDDGIAVSVLLEEIAGVPNGVMVEDCVP
jgi:hypothetical protein